jgi:hypothetical protein
MSPSTSSAPSPAAQRPASPPLPVIKYGYQHVVPHPQPIDDEALAILTDIRGQSAVDEVESQIRALDDTVRHFLGRMTDRQGVSDAVRVLPDIFARRAKFRARTVALRRLLALPETSVGDGPKIPVLNNPGNFDREFGFLITSQLNLARKELDRIQASIDSYVAVMRNDERYCEAVYPLDMATGGPHLGAPVLPQDGVLERLNAWCSRRREIQARVSALEGDLQRATQLVSTLVKKAVNDAGGFDAVVTGTIAADALTSPQPTWAAATAEHAAAEASLRKLEAAGVKEGPAYTAAQARSKEAAAQLDSAKGEDVAKRRAVALGIVEDALAGTEKGRARLESLANSAPSAFARGFASAIAAARYDVAVIVQLSEALAAV